MGCLEENTVLAVVDGRLKGEALSHVKNHLAACAACIELVAAAARTGSPHGTVAAADEEGATPLAKGATVGRYVILDLVGSGGMGDVYAAYDPQLDRKVALKLLRDTGAAADLVPLARARLLREAKAIARLSHPNVVVVHDAGEIDDRVFLAMEFIEGQTLAGWLSERARSWREIREVFMAAGRGLAAAHEAGLVHRDFKPQNVMVERSGPVRVMDFGLASDAATGDRGAASDAVVAPAGTLTAGTVALTHTGMLLGTPLYMAPEQLQMRGTDARTDQFSFCVSLFEALYGQRPFAARSFPELVASVVAGKVVDSQKARVPAFFRKILLRGLRPNPDDRWPSMAELLDALDHDPARWPRRFAVAGAAALVVVAAAVGSQRITSRGQRLCRAGGDRLGAAWELVDGGPRRSSVHRAFLATGQATAWETWDRVSRLLDDRGRQWVSMYTGACEATHARGDQSADVLDLRMACLDGQLGAMRALTDVLSRANGAVLIQAVNAVQALPPIERCADVALLRAVVPPPSDPDLLARVRALAVELSEVKALKDTGQWSQAFPRAKRLVEEARSTGHQPLLTDALMELAWLQDSRGDSKGAVGIWEEALWGAVASRKDDAALQSAASLAGISGYFLGQYSEAERWERMGAALLARLGPGHERWEAWLIQARANLRAVRGDIKGELALSRAALALKRKALAPNHPDIAVSLTNMAVALNELGDLGPALDAANEAVDIYRSAYGPGSALLDRVLGNRGEVLKSLGRNAEAEIDLREAIKRSAESIGPEHHWIGHPLTALGELLVGQGRSAEARPVLERALRLREQSEPIPDLVAETRFALARALSESGQDRPLARRLAEAARDAYRALPHRKSRAAEVEEWLVRFGGGVSSSARP